MKQTHGSETAEWRPGSRFTSFYSGRVSGKRTSTSRSLIGQSFRATSRPLIGPHWAVPGMQRLAFELTNQRKWSVTELDRNLQNFKEFVCKRILLHKYRFLCHLLAERLIYWFTGFEKRKDLFSIVVESWVWKWLHKIYVPIYWCISTISSLCRALLYKVCIYRLSCRPDPIRTSFWSIKKCIFCVASLPGGWSWNMQALILAEHIQIQSVIRIAEK